MTCCTNTHYEHACSWEVMGHMLYVLNVALQFVDAMTSIPRGWIQIIISSHPCSIRSSAHFSSIHPPPCWPPALHPHPHLCTLPPFSPPHSDSLTNDPPLSGNILLLSLGVRASALINPSFAELHQHEQEKFCGEKKDLKGFYIESQCIPIITFKSPQHKTKPLHWWICVSLLLTYMWIFTQRRFHSHVYSFWPNTRADESINCVFQVAFPVCCSDVRLDRCHWFVSSDVTAVTYLSGW